MTKESAYRLLIGFSIPLFFGNLFQQLYSMVDTVIVGRFVGLEALAAVGSTSGFVFMVNGFGQGLANGFAVPVSQKYGAKDYEAMRRNYAMSILASISVGAVVCIFFLLLSRWLLELVHTPENIIDGAAAYITIIYAGIIAVIYYNLFSAVLRAVGDSNSPLIFLLVSSILNILLDLFFVIVVPLGCAGVAVATVIAQAISTVLAYVYIRKRYPIFRLEKKDWRIDMHTIWNLLRIGIPGGIQFSVCAIGVVIVQAAINTFGSDIVAAYSVGTKIEGLMSVIFPVFGMAISTYAGQNLGAGNMDRIKNGFKAIVVIAFATSIVISVLTFLLAEPVSYIFVDRKTTSDIVIDSAVYYARTVSLFFIPLASIFIFRTGSQGLGSGGIPLMSSLCELALRTIAAMTLPSVLGYTGVVLASPIAWVGAGILCPVCCIAYLKKKEKQLT